MKYNDTLSRRTERAIAAVASFLVALATIVSMGASCWATTAEGVTPVTLSQGATAYDFEVTETIEMSASANSTVLTIDDFTITNKSNVGKIGYDLSAAGSNGYTIVADTEDFDSMSVSAKKYSLVANTSHDLSSDYESVAEVDSGNGSDTVNFTGHISPTDSEVSEGTQVGSITATISWL